ncbi:UbiA family prenyltransferase [Klenkia terrae]|uniref:UbiA family prenyltransferase n=1 Tax=Klenkia terrae TaxID=1052259 RepID=UPI0036126C11
MATLLAVTADVGPARTVLVAVAVLAGQASIGWSNDWLDADRDAAVARADKPTVQGLVTPARLRTCALVAVVLAVVTSLALGPAPGVLLLGVVAGGWAYNAGLKRTAASLLPYLVAFGLLPAGVVAAAPGTPVAPWWLVAAGALLGARPTWPTSPPTWRTTRPPASAGCRTGSGPPPRRWWPPGCWGRRRWCSSWARPAARRRSAGWRWWSPSPRWWWPASPGPSASGPPPSPRSCC